MEKVVELTRFYGDNIQKKPYFILLKDFIKYWLEYCPVRDSFFCDTEENRKLWHRDNTKFICKDPEPFLGGTDYILWNIKTVKPDETYQVISLEEALKIKYNQN